MKKTIIFSMKRLKAFIVCLLLFVSYFNTSQAQYYFYNDAYYDNPVLFELGGSFGLMNCLTDLGGKKGIGKKFVKDLNVGKTNFAGGLYFSAMYKYAVVLRLEATFGKVAADDEVLKSVDVKDIARQRFNRNVNFRSNISEFSIITEIHPLFIFIDWTSRDENPPRFSPYFLGGVGYFSFNPQGKLGSNWYDLQPLHTEGQGLVEYPDKPNYKLKQINFPVGFGIKYELSDLINLRGEFVYRILNTDYLDDVSTTYIDPTAFSNPQNGMSASQQSLAFKFSNRQLNNITGPGGKRGSPAQKDAYFTFNVKLGINIGRERIK